MAFAAKARRSAESAATTPPSESAVRAPSPVLSLRGGLAFAGLAAPATVSPIYRDTALIAADDEACERALTNWLRAPGLAADASAAEWRDASTITITSVVAHPNFLGFDSLGTSPDRAAALGAARADGVRGVQRRVVSVGQPADA